MTDEIRVLLAAIGLALMLGVLGRLALRGRLRLAWSDAVVAGMFGAVVGSLFGLLLPGGPRPGLAGAVALCGTAALMVHMESRGARRRQEARSIADLISDGESDSVEFKSSARFNRHTGTRDERIELAVVKSVAGFLNAGGGALVIGVADDGSITGLDDDYVLIKAPDRDRFELWLLDLFRSSLGVVAATDLSITFDDVGGRDVCVVRAPAARRPVFVHEANHDAASFWVRIGNSTRQLNIEDALTYCVDRWGSRALRQTSAPTVVGVRARLSGAVRKVRTAPTYDWRR